MDYRVLVVVVVVVVVVRTGSGPVSGIGNTRSLFGVHLSCFCVSAVLAISCKKNIINVRGSTGRSAFCSVLEGLNSGGGFLGSCCCCCCCCKERIGSCEWNREHQQFVWGAFGLCLCVF